MAEPASGEALARQLDSTDPVPSSRSRFDLPLGPDGETAIYACGHSLGPLPRRARDMVQAELDAWARLGIEGHFRARDPWLTYAEGLAEPTADLVGARPTEVVTMNGLTVNLHLLLASVYRPGAGRDRILIEEGAFPSDRYALASQMRLRGVDPGEALLQARPRPGEATLRTGDIEAIIEAERDRLALVWLPGVTYLTGQVLDIERLTAAAHAAGAVSGWDLAHAVGNIPLRLHDWAVDVAAWCTYKYLNGGPGSVGQAFLHERWALDPSVPRLAGWWGNDPASRLSMPREFVPHLGAASWQVSGPPILAMIPLRASLEIFREAGIDRLRERAGRLTAYLQDLLDDIAGVRIVTPRATEERGAMLCLRVLGRSQAVQDALARRGVVLDVREPDTLRLALAPLYNTFEEAWRLSVALREVLAELEPAIDDPS